MKDKKCISVLGSTGSVGEQALDVAARAGMEVLALCAGKNAVRAEEQARRFCPRAVAMADEAAAKELKVRLADTGISVLSGESGICEMIAAQPIHTVVNAITGKAGLIPTLATIDAGHRLALANKESLVVAGDIVMSRSKEKRTEILPVDSEHSAIFQSLKSGEGKEVKKILLTASGGPFFGYTTEQIKNVGISDTLAHPTWNMGAKITVDSATLMNKGFEVIEAVHLFGVQPSQIQVVVHRESIIHSMVEYIDNSVIAQLSRPDMRLCVQYAVTYPERTAAVIEELDLFSLSGLTFKCADTVTFPLLALAYSCIEQGGALPAVLNAANEVAVAAFLDGKTEFYRISEIVAATVDALSDSAKALSLEDILAFDREARAVAEKFLR